LSPVKNSAAHRLTDILFCSVAQISRWGLRPLV